MASSRKQVRARRDRQAVRSLWESLEPRLLLSGTLAAWFRADSITSAAGTGVASWQDASGNGLAASQVDPAHRPTLLAGALNGQPAVHFDATGMTQLSFPRTVSGDFTLVVVFRSAQGISHSSNWFDDAGLVDGDVAGVNNDFGLSLNSLGQVIGGTGNPDHSAASGVGFNDGNTHVAVFVRNIETQTESIYVDGLAFAQSATGTQPLTAPPRLTIGSLQTNTNYITGDIGEVRVYSSALAASERTQIEDELESRYGIAPPPSEWFSNPVINSDFADPGSLTVNGTYYAFSTNAHGFNIQAAKSQDLVHWTSLPDALPTLPSWSAAGRTWAPDAIPVGDHYDLYYTAFYRGSQKQAIGVATSPTPAGPYTPAGTAPLVVQADLGGAIDASPFTDTDGTHYLVWKSDGNSSGKPTWIYIQQLSADGLSLVGTPTQLFKADQTWEGSIVEGPTLWKHDGKYYIFYSANNFGNASYATGYAVASSPLGPYVKGQGPLVRSENGVLGPGGPDIVIGPDGNTWMLYHSWQNNFAYRSMSVDQLDWTGDVPYLRGPTFAPQPAPVPPAPTLTVVRADPSGTFASGTVFGPPDTTLTLNFTAGGNALAGSTTVTTDDNGNARFVNVSTGALAVGATVSATVTDAAQDAGPPSAAADVRLSGDVNGDNAVGFADLLALAQHYNTAGPLADGDANGDGVIDFADLLLVAQDYGRSAAATLLASSARRRA